MDAIHQIDPCSVYPVQYPIRWFLFIFNLFALWFCQITLYCFSMNGLHNWNMHGLQCLLVCLQTTYQYFRTKWDHSKIEWLSVWLINSSSQFWMVYWDYDYHKHINLAFSYICMCVCLYRYGQTQRKTKLPMQNIAMHMRIIYSKTKTLIFSYNNGSIPIHHPPLWWWIYYSNTQS